MSDITLTDNAAKCLELIEGMGHDLPQPLLPHFVQLIGDHADRALTGTTTQSAISS